jgi:hypothetical protein
VGVQGGHAAGLAEASGGEPALDAADGIEVLAEAENEAELAADRPQGVEGGAAVLREEAEQPTAELGEVAGEGEGPEALAAALEAEAP